MLNSSKSPLLLSAMLSAVLGLTACSSPSSENTDNAAAESSATADDKLDTKFVTIATGGASGPYNIIVQHCLRFIPKPLGSTQRRRPQAHQLKTSIY